MAVLSAQLKRCHLSKTHRLVFTRITTLVVGILSGMNALGSVCQVTEMVP